MQILGIPFRSIPRKRTQLGIPFHAIKIEIYSRNAVWTIPWKRNQHHFVKLFCCCFAKLVFSAEFHSVSFRSELRNWLFRGTRNASEWVFSSAELRKSFRVYSAEFFRNEIPFPTLSVRCALPRIFLWLTERVRLVLWLNVHIVKWKKRGVESGCNSNRYDFPYNRRCFLGTHKGILSCFKSQLNN